MTSAQENPMTPETDPCINAFPVPCDHDAAAHDEDGCRECECGRYVTDGAES
jgi:hypothetical protein